MCGSPSNPRLQCTPSATERLGQAGVSRGSPGQRKHWVWRWAGRTAAGLGWHGTTPLLYLQGSPPVSEKMKMLIVEFGEIMKKFQVSTKQNTDLNVGFTKNQEQKTWKLFAFGAVLRMNWGVSEYEDRSYSVVWWYSNRYFCIDGHI